MFFFVAGGLMAMLIRAELAQPGTQFVDPNTYNGLFSVHASLMIFLFIIPVFAGIANFVIPLMIGAPDMAFPRLNALSYWMLPVAGTMMICSYFAEGGAFATGWTAYAPLSTESPMGQQFFTLGVQFAGASSIATALNFLVTIITMRAPGMTFWRMPLLVWANFTTSLLVVIAAPFIAGSQFFVLLDRTIGTRSSTRPGGRAHVPARVLVLLAPGGLHHDAAGLRDHQRGHLHALAQAGVRLPDDGVLTGGDRDPRVHGLGAPHVRVRHAELAADTHDDHHDAHRRPPGIKIFSWLATLWRGVIHMRTPLLFALGFITMFTLGGISGIMLAVVPFDIHVSDTYFIVAHIHYVLFGGSVFTIFAGLYHWFPKMTGRMYDETLGRIHFWLSFIFFNLTFGPMHFVGIDGMPRRVADYADQFATWNAIISISAFVFGLSFLIFLYNMVASARRPAPGNPWRAHSIEWQVSSPPPVFNFDSIPTVVGGPYEYGVPGAVHAVFKEEKPAAVPTPAGGAARRHRLSHETDPRSGQ